MQRSVGSAEPPAARGHFERSTGFIAGDSCFGIRRWLLWYQRSLWYRQQRCRYLNVSLGLRLRGDPACGEDKRSRLRSEGRRAPPWDGAGRGALSAPSGTAVPVVYHATAVAGPRSQSRGAPVGNACGSGAPGRMVALECMAHWRRILYVSFVAQTLSLIGFSFVFPFLPLYIQTLGVRGRA